MTDLRRALLWGIFSVSLVMLWDGWNRHNGQPSMFAPPVTAPATPQAGASSVPAPVATAAVAAASAAAPGAVPATQAVPPAGERFVVTTDLVKATFDTRGGSLVRVELLHQKDGNGHMVVLDQSAQRLYVAETGLVAAGAPGAVPDHTTVMKPTTDARALADGQDSLAIGFEASSAAGIKLVKTYTFQRGSYAVGVKHEVSNAGAAAVQPQLYLQLVRDGNPLPDESSFYSTFTGPAIYTDADKYQKVEFKDIEKRKAGDKPSHAARAENGWVAMVQHYFAAAWLPTGNAPRDFYTRKVSDNLYSVGMLMPLGELAPAASTSVEARLFVGPQQEKALEALAPGLELVKDYGWLTILAKPLFWLLDKLHGLLGNWGWSIVALVVLLKIAFYWLNASAYRSMGKMKAINPKIQEMRERLKDKPQQMQQEMMRIYREEKVNPIGGCLPIFVQMPFFIALYWVLLSSVEMRGAPWLGWVTDLSVKDPYFILPLLMTATTVLQTWLNPTPPDPVQAKMMWIMPLAFSVMFFFFPAGLVLYWFVNNLLSIAQQWAINRSLGLNK
ncbi:membrane protein insertase YidC [Leptothrix discophora]|uniref:Membrane protein insertase YidC n=1 Tax=Leptothrix discophora TaxID=89 RepID=A0ABT9G3Q6_LEPDI|nr:membrane protein insertase YidC [Leptothrix discophora]MDP4301123.1 membrane protein insertase YidC [Leptothrix discophora]